MSNDYVNIRVLSGPHIGASLDLALGRYVIGSDDSCDIIFQDKTVAPRHAALVVSAAPDGGEGFPVRVTIRPLDEGLYLHDELITESQAWEPGQPAVLGFCALAWNYPDAPWELIELRPSGLLKPPANPAAEGDLAQGIPMPVAFPEAQDSDLHPARPRDDELAPQEPVPPRLLFGKPRWLLGGVVAGALLLLAVSINWNWAGFVERKNAAELTELLEQANFKNLEVQRGEYGLMVSGQLESDDDFIRLTKLVQSLPNRVYLNIKVQNDTLKSIREDFNHYGFYPDVSYTEEGELLVTSYIKDAALESKIFAVLEADGPEYKNIRRQIFHAEQVEAVLREQLILAGLERVAVKYGQGALNFTEPFNETEKAALGAVVNTTGEILGVHLEYGFEASPTGPKADPPAQFVPEITAQAASSPDSGLENDIGQSFQIMAITLKPLKFVTLKSGQKIFEGGQLPNGYILTKITDYELTLVKGERTINYKVRGAND